MANLDDPAFASSAMSGLTKREYAAIRLGIPESGDADMDVIIKKSSRRAYFRAIVTSVFHPASRSEFREGFVKDVREVSDAVVAAIEVEEAKNGF